MSLAMPGGAPAAACPNEAVRTGASAALPDCRAYELVSPVGLEPRVTPGNEGEVVGVQAAAAGDKVAFFSLQGAPAGSPSAGQYFLSKRVSEGWSSEDVIPRQSTIRERFCYPWIFF
jgi:hypothetical protein